MNNVLVISNLSAGRRQAIKYKKKIRKILIGNGAKFKFISIDLLNETDVKPYDFIIVIGGDGTINKVLPYIVNTEKFLGIIPCGTANLLAAKLGIKNANNALKIIEKETSTKVDILKINNFLSILRCGLGFDADIIGKTPQSMKNKFGYFSYFIAGIIFALRLKCKEYLINLNNEQRKINASCIIIANAANMYRNLFSIAKESKLNDGSFDIFILKTENPIIFFIEFLKILFNIKLNSSIAEYINAESIEIENNYCLTHIDGEKIKFKDNLKFKVIKNAVNILCDEKLV